VLKVKKSAVYLKDSTKKNMQELVVSNYKASDSIVSFFEDKLLN